MYTITVDPRVISLTTKIWYIVVENEELNNLINLTIRCDDNRKQYFVPGQMVPAGGGLGYFMSDETFDSFVTFVQKGESNLKYFKPMSNTNYYRLVREFSDMCHSGDYISSDYFHTFLRKNERFFTEAMKELFNETFGRIMFSFDNVIPFPVKIQRIK